MTTALRWGRVSQFADYPNPEKTASPAVTCPADQGGTKQNDAGTRGALWQEIDTSNSRNVPPKRRVFDPDLSAAGRMVTYSLTLGDRAAFDGLTAVLAARLTPVERAELARAALLSLDDPEYVQIAEALSC
jgi:hypothetical protein